MQCGIGSLCRWRPSESVTGVATVHWHRQLRFLNTQTSVDQRRRCRLACRSRIRGVAEAMAQRISEQAPMATAQAGAVM